jgi:hypothetical protein
MADVRYVITVDSTGATKSVQTFDKAIEDLGKTSATVKASTSSFGSEFMKNLIPAFTAATLAADAVRKGLRFIKDQLVETVGAAIEAEKVDRALESSILTVGEASGGTARSIQAYASALQKKTLYDDEAIKSAQALIIQMRGTTAGLGDATKGAIGLASVFGMDLQSAARSAVQGMEGNYVMLGRMIPAIRNATTEAEKHAAMMDFFAGAYRRAEDEVNTFSGKIRDAKDAYGELQESIGAFVTKNQTVIDTLSGVKEIIEWIDRNAKKADASKTLKVFDFTAFGAMAKALKGVGDAAKKANEDYAKSWEGMTAALLESRQPMLEAPVLIQKLGDRAAKAKDPIYDLSRALIYLHNTVKTPTPTPMFDHIEQALYKIDIEKRWGFQLDWLQGKAADTSSSVSDSWSMAMESMTAGLVSFGDANATVWGNVGNIFGNFLKSYLSGLESMVLKQIWAAKMGTAADKAKAQSGAISSIFSHIHWPISLIVAAGSFALVNSLFSKILKFERGGYFDTATMLPAHMVGEAGPEYYLPETKLVAAVQKGVRGRASDGTLAGAPGVSYAITVNGPIFQTTAALTDGMIREKSRVFFDEMENQARIRGRRLTNG